MDYIKVNNSDKAEVMQQFRGITNSGTLVDKVFSYLQKHEEILDDDEYVKEITELPHMPPGFMGMMIMNTKYSVNVRKSTIVIIAFLLDLSFSKGIASLTLNLIGFSTQVLQKIKNEEKCLITDILLRNKKEAGDFNYNNNECVQNDIECPYRDENICKRTIEIINSQLERLIEQQIIKKKDGYLKQAF